MCDFTEFFLSSAFYILCSSVGLAEHSLVQTFLGFGFRQYKSFFTTMLWKHHLVLITTVFISLGSGQPPPKKFAPSYCLRFKFNCQNEEKKGHVCCLFPLPENGQVDNQPAIGGKDTLQENPRIVRIPPIVRLILFSKSLAF